MIETNAIEVWDKFERFETKEMKKALVGGLRGAASELRKSVKRELKQSIPNSNKKNPKYYDTLAQGVRITKVKEMKGYFQVYTTIASNRKTGSGSFRLHILEGGTTQRYAYIRGGNHKPAYRGKIKSYNFFDSALSSFRPLQEKIIQNEIDKAIIKINNKKFK